MSKKWGQHFLIRRGVVEEMLECAGICSCDSVLEIGAGRGFLTQALLQRKAQVTSIEVDPELCDVLKTIFGTCPGFHLLEGDVMSMSIEDLAECHSPPYKLVANLPYQIATALLLRLLPVRRAWTSLTVMVQDEVAERICATPQAKKHFGPLSIAAGLAFKSRIVTRVPPQAFRPPPKVRSAVVHLVPMDSGMKTEEESVFLDWTRRLFQHRRKTLINNIQRHFPEWHRRRAGALKQEWGMRRPDGLSLEEWKMLFRDYQV